MCFGVIIFGPGDNPRKSEKEKIEFHRFSIKAPTTNETPLKPSLFQHRQGLRIARERAHSVGHSSSSRYHLVIQSSHNREQTGRACEGLTLHRYEDAHFLVQFPEREPFGRKSTSKQPKASCRRRKNRRNKHSAT